MLQLNVSPQNSVEMQTCIQECLSCYSHCASTLRHCMEMGGKHNEPSHIILLMDCAEICQISADFMLRSSPLHARTCGLCAQICERCADDCERIDPNDEQMKLCAEICRHCATACQRMAA